MSGDGIRMVVTSGAGDWKWPQVRLGHCMSSSLGSYINVFNLEKSSNCTPMSCAHWCVYAIQIGFVFVFCLF